MAIDPPSQTVEVGQPVTVDLLITGLEATGVQDIVSAFDLDVRYDPAILAFAGAALCGWHPLIWRGAEQPGCGQAALQLSVAVGAQHLGNDDLVTR